MSATWAATYPIRSMSITPAMSPGASTVSNTQQRRPYAGLRLVLNAFSDANSSYHGLQLSIERRVSNKLSFEANYTWSKSIDDASADQEPGQGTSIIPSSLEPIAACPTSISRTGS